MFKKWLDKNEISYEVQDGTYLFAYGHWYFRVKTEDLDKFKTEKDILNYLFYSAYDKGHTHGYLACKEASQKVQPTFNPFAEPV